MTAPKRWAFMSRFEVPNLDDPEQTYLNRLRIVTTPWGAVFLHRMDGPDSRPTLHDHPWNFVSLVLRGGYIERRLNPHDLTVNEARRVRWFNRVRTHDAHAITSLLRVPTLTLLLVGPRRRKWGYWDPDPEWTGAVPRWKWTAFDAHPHAVEFDLAMEKRKRLETTL